MKMQSLLRRCGAAVLFASCLLLTGYGTVQAVLLPPGGNVSLTGTTAAARPELNATVLESVTLPVNYEDGAGHRFNGSLQHNVARSNVDNTLIFSYRLISNASSTLPITRLAVFQCLVPDIVTDVDFRLDGLGSAPPFRATRGPDGKQVVFDFAQHPLLPGNSTRFCFVKTDVMDYLPLDTARMMGAGTGTATHDLFAGPTFLPVSLATLTGKIILSNFVGEPKVNLTFRTDDDCLVFVQSLTLSSTGAFQTRIPCSYRLRGTASRTGFLRKGMDLPVDFDCGQLIQAGTITMLSGDANGDNSVDVLDIDVLIQSFDLTASDPNFIPGADFNGDNSVDVLDIDLLIQSFDMLGDE